MKQQLLDNFARLYERQDQLAALSARSFLHGYSYTEIHCLALVGEDDSRNVTNIADIMGMTRGAVSKVMKKLVADHLVARYQFSYNRKEIHFRLTPAGDVLYREHRLRHARWEARDRAFFDRWPDETLETVNEFLTAFNRYLAGQAEAILNEK